MSAAGKSAVNGGLLERVAVVARAAGREILEVYTSDALAPTAKADNSPLTAADLRWEAETRREGLLVGLTAPTVWRPVRDGFRNFLIRRT